MARSLFPIAVLLVLIAWPACGARGGDTRELVRELNARLERGMSRAEVEAVLRDLDVNFVYVSPELLKQTGMSVPPGGRIDGHSHYERGFGRIMWVTVKIELDADMRATEIDVQSGFSGL